MAQTRRADKAQPAAAAEAGPRILKKYPNRRLYDTEISSYITLADVKAMVLKGIDFEVRDAKTGEDLTRSILLQIILEEETGGVPIFSTSTLAQIIRFYGHAMQGMMGSYLEQNLQTFTDVQARLAEQSKGLYDPKLQSPELWTKFLSGQAPMVQNLMGNYLEQSRNIFMQMQEQLNKQAEARLPRRPRPQPADQAMSRGARLARQALVLVGAVARCLVGDAGAQGRRRAAQRRAAAPAASAGRPPRRRRPSSTARSSAATTYVAEVFYDARALRTWRPVKDVHVGKNVAWTIAWTNLDQFPALKTAATQARAAAACALASSRPTCFRDRRSCRGWRPTAARSSPSSRSRTGGTDGPRSRCRRGIRRSAKIRR